MKIGDPLPVEIAGTEIGTATLSEVTDEYIEVVYRGYPIKLPADALDYYDLFGL